MPRLPKKADVGVIVPVRISADELNDRQIKGAELHKDGERSNGKVILLNDTTTLYFSSKSNSAYQVTRESRNLRGTRQTEYRCDCGDFKKNGRIPCYHIFAEQLRRAEVVILGPINHRRTVHATAGRRPPRKRVAHDGKADKSVQRDARSQNPRRVPELVTDVKRLYIQAPTDAPDCVPLTSRKDNKSAVKAISLVHKIANGSSADAMVPVFGDLIERGFLPLSRPPHQNTLTNWMNDPSLTPVLQRMLQITARPFRAIEIAAIVDSSKVSQMRSAHSRYVEYGNDTRDQADWAKLHALVGVETLVCMAAEISGSIGADTHDSKFVLRLVERANKVFRLKCLLGDKAYLSEEIVGVLREWGIQATIPLKKNSDPSTKKDYYEAYADLAERFDNRQTEFHEIYRLRPKIESFFSMMKNVADGYCWSRGRRHAGLANANTPCTAWVNESLCKLIYCNMRTTVRYELFTGYTMNYLTDTFFRELPKEDKLIA
jgi:hypothetical protein